MELITSPVLWIVLTLSLGIPALFIVSVRYVVVRLAGRFGGSLPVAAPDASAIPLPRFASRAQAIRILLLAAVMGMGVGIILLKYVYGIGAISNLSDQFPWGVWIGIDVMSGIALAAGGFVIAGTVHIFGIKRFEPLIRPAILTAFLGYALEVAGLMADLGRPYNLWQPMVHWRPYSMMWVVGMCVASLLTIYIIQELLPAVLEKLSEFEVVADRLPIEMVYNLLKKTTIIVVFLSVVISMLHQSSLGSLWVLVPGKLSAIWYSLYLPLFFLISAVVAGLTMVIVESYLSSKAFDHGLEIDLMADLGKMAAIILSVYLVARGMDMTVKGVWPMVFEPTLQAATFWPEMILGVVAPIILFSVKSWRYNPKILFRGAVLALVFGIVLNRLNVSLFGILPYTGYVYTPSWMEIMVTISLHCFGVVAFVLAIKYLPIFPHEDEHGAH